MAETILQQVKVDRTDAYFNWVKSLRFERGNSILTPEQRNDEFNAILYLTVKNLMNTYGDSVGTMDPMEILITASNYMPVMFTLYCQISLLNQGITIDQEIMSNINKKVEVTDLTTIFKTLSLQRMNNNNKPFMLDPIISAYSFGLNTDTRFIDEFVKKFIPFNMNISVVTELIPGHAVCGCTLVRLISKKEHSEVWEAQRRNRKVAIKLESLGLDDKEYNELTKKTSNFDKILNHIKTTDSEWINYTKLKDFPYKLNYFTVDYYDPLRKKVKIMSWLEGPVDKVTIEDKKVFIYAMYDIVFELHKRGLMLNGFSPNHIMIKPNIIGEETGEIVKSNYRIVDYKYITEFKGADTNIYGNYKSLSLLSGTNSVTPYDDVESILFTINDLISNKVAYNDKQDEFSKKSELSSISNLISDAINSLRLLRQQDIYVNGLMKPVDYSDYISSIYDRGLTVNGQLYQGIKSILGNVYSLYNEVTAIEISLVKPDFILLKKIKSDIASSTDLMFRSLYSDPTKMNEVCIAILNYMVNGYTPLPEFQPYINQYLM